MQQWKEGDTLNFGLKNTAQKYKIIEQNQTKDKHYNWSFYTTGLL